MVEGKTPGSSGCSPNGESELKLLAGGEWRSTGNKREVRSPYDGSLVSNVCFAGPAEVELAISSAAAAFEETRSLPSWKKSEILQRIGRTIAERREELAIGIAQEAGKPLKTARIEVDRAAFVYEVAAEEARRISGEIISLDWIPGTEDRTGYVHRVPLGPVAGITPFNFPLNLVSHKVAPALASGNPIIIKPASQTPITALRLGEIVLGSGWPAGGFSVIPSSPDVATPLIEDERIKMLTFTGSPVVGWALRQRVGRKRVTLELGGNAAVIVHSDADLELAASRVAWGAFVNAGQTCISVQRVFVESSVFAEFSARLVREAKALVWGDPLDDATDVGPLISAGDADRIQEWVEEATRMGARLLTGGTRHGSVVEPTIICNAPGDCRVCCEEAFGPVLVLSSYEDVRQAIESAGCTKFGLQAGIFTHDMRIVHQAFESIDVGGLMVNDVSTFRIDHMPYGGVRESGMRREGIRYAIEEMTEMKLLMVRHEGLAQ